MAKSQRTTVYLDGDLHRALRLKAVASNCNVSELINEAVRAALAEDLSDIEAFDARVDEADRSFETFVRELTVDGAL